VTQCWPEGALRAYLDGELPTVDMQLVAAHLGECRVCDGLCRELAARVAHVSALMELLPEQGEAMPRPTGVPRRRANWIGVAVALAAGLAVAAYLLPDRHPRETLVRPAPTPAPRRPSLRLPPRRLSRRHRGARTVCARPLRSRPISWRLTTNRSSRESSCGWM
jgi:anti-sigma factor RsiW